MHGVRQPVNVEVTGWAVRENHGETRLGLSMETSISRAAFHIRWNNLMQSGDPVVQDDAEVTVDIEAIRTL